MYAARLSSSATTCRPGQCRPRVAGRRLTVVPKAISLQELSGMVANAFVRIFSKPETNVDKFAENNFSGKISHHERSRKPFADGYVAPVKPSATLERTDEEAESYLQGAVNRVANHNFVGDESEPKVYPVNDGFKGDIHSGHGAERDGFHSKKL